MVLIYLTRLYGPRPVRFLFPYTALSVPSPSALGNVRFLEIEMNVRFSYILANGLFRWVVVAAESTSCP